MARIRQFKPTFFTDDKVGRLTREARLFFFGVLSEADDEGRLVDSPKRLAGVVFPFDDDVTPKKVERWIDELVTQRMVVRYSHEGGRFLYVRKFKDHQKMSHPTPSALPTPPPDQGNPSGNPPEKRRRNAGETPEDFAPVFEGVFEGVFVSEGVSTEPSSSIHHRVAPASADDDDGSRIPEPPPTPPLNEALGLIADRRIATSTTPIANPRAYRSTVLRSVAEGLGSDIVELLDEGLSPAEICDRLEPLPAPRAPEPSPYPAAGQQLAPVFDEVFDEATGEWRTVRVSA